MSNDLLIGGILLAVLAIAVVIPTVRDVNNWWQRKKLIREIRRQDQEADLVDEKQPEEKSKTE